MTFLMPDMDHKARIERLRDTAKLRANDAIFVSNMSNIRYLTGFAGSAGILLVFRDSAYLLVDGRYVEDAGAEQTKHGVEVVGTESGQQFNAIEAIAGRVKRLIVDSSQVTADVYIRLQEIISGEIEKLRGAVERLRLTKDVGELWRLRKAAQVALSAFESVIGTIELEPTEKQFAMKLEARMKELGADSVGFSTIVASGSNSSKPHAHPTDRKIREGEPVVVDFGATIDGYHSDITRTVWFGELSPNVKPIYEAAVAAHEAGVASARAGVPHAEVDARCRAAAAELGYAEKPLHPSGHNLGLDIHERPFLSPYVDEMLESSYVITVEPGIYVPGVAGCRIENMVLVSSREPEVLSEGVEPTP